MSRLIAVAGLPGTGKSHLARELAAHYGLPLFSKDDFKEILFDTVGFKNREEKTRLNDASLRDLFYAADHVLSCGSGVILENNFENNAYPYFESLQEKYPDLEVITVLIGGEMRVMYERWKRRDQNPRRHQGHVRNDHYPADEGEPVPPPLTFEEYGTRFHERGMDTFHVGRLVRVDVTDFSKVDNEAMFREIGD